MAKLAAGHFDHGNLPHCPSVWEGILADHRPLYGPGGRLCAGPPAGRCGVWWRYGSRVVFRSQAICLWGVFSPGARSDYGGHLSRYGDGICGRHDSHCHGLCRPFANPSGAAGWAALRRPVQRAVWGVQFRTEHLLQRRRGDHRQHPCSQPSRDGDQRPSDRRCGVGSQVCSVAVHSAGACVGRGVPLPHWGHVDGRR